MDFVFVSIQPIDVDRNSTSISIARELAREHRVLYVNPPLQRREYWFGTNDQSKPVQKVNNKNIGEIEVKNISPGLWMLDTGRIMESINWLPITSLVKSLTLINSRRFAAAIDKAVHLLGFSNYTIVNDKDIFRSFYLKELLRPEKYVYLNRDYTLGVPYWKRHGINMEPELMHKSDVVVCNSPTFRMQAKQVNPNSFYIGNGYDDSNFNSSSVFPVPVDLDSIPHPRIAYIGAMVSTRLDKDLFVQVARSKPEWNFVLLGWEDDLFQKSDLHRLKNVHFLGKKRVTEVPAYLFHCDVAINPQLLNPITAGNFPLKIVEYLAMGLPVVASSTQTMIELFSEHVYLSDTQDQFVSQLAKALSEDDDYKRKSRIKFAGKFTWQKVTNRFLQVVAQNDQAGDFF
jgi:teichuronic acid biosynthesis glycosyltransferase TuaH